MNVIRLRANVRTSKLLKLRKLQESRMIHNEHESRLTLDSKNRLRTYRYHAE
jgi:hypothetical protein